MKTARLGSVAIIDRQSIQPENIGSRTLYVGLENIETGGRLVNVKQVDCGDLASSKFKFTSRHLLYGKLRPYLAKIALPSFDGICSTDILPILPSRELDVRYLKHYLSQQRMVDIANSLATGANLPRLSPKSLECFEIPLPPLSEQKRIVAILDKADEIQKKRSLAIQKLDQLAESVFVEMFGADTQYQRKPLSDVSDLKRGPFGGALKKEIFVQTGAMVYEQRNAIDGDCLTGRYFISEEKYKQMRDFAVEEGDLIVSCSGTMGRVALITAQSPKGIINQALLRVRAHRDEILPEFLQCVLTSVEIQRQIGRAAHGTGLQNFPPMQTVKDFSMPAPPLKQQQEFLRRLKCIQARKAIALLSEGALTRLRSSLSSSYLHSA